MTETGRPRRRAALVLVAAVLATGLVLETAVAPDVAPARATEASDLDREIDERRDDLDDISRTLAEIERELDRVTDEVEALDRRLAGATAELREVTVALAAARDAVAAARERAEAATAELAVAEEELARVEDELARTRSRLELRLVRTFKYGTVSTADVVVRGATGALDLHGYAVALAGVGRMTADDRALVSTATRLAEEQRVRIVGVTEVRAAAEEAGRVAQTEEARTEELVAQQRAVVGRIEADRSRRATVLAALEDDAEVKAALAAKLRRQIAALEARRLVVTQPPGGPPPSGSPEWAARLPDRGKPYAEMINQAGVAQGVDGRLMAALVWTESYFNPNAVSSAGAVGLAQLMPGTARGLGLRVDAEVDERYDPVLNVNAGAKYLRYQLVRFGSVELALAAYNAGPTRVASCMCIPNITETQLYVVRVLTRYETIVG